MKSISRWILDHRIVVILLYTVIIAASIYADSLVKVNYKQQISQVEGVKDVTWLDDSADITTPVEMMDQGTLDAWYKDDSALMTAYVDSSHAKAALSEIRAIIG